MAFYFYLGLKRRAPPHPGPWLTDNKARRAFALAGVTFCAPYRRYQVNGHQASGCQPRALEEVRSASATPANANARRCLCGEANRAGWPAPGVRGKNTKSGTTNRGPSTYPQWAKPIGDDTFRVTAKCLRIHHSKPITSISLNGNSGSQLNSCKLTNLNSTFLPPKYVRN